MTDQETIALLRTGADCARVQADRAFSEAAEEWAF